jgi:uncharacterized metal-binding protein
MRLLRPLHGTCHGCCKVCALKQDVLALQRVHRVSEHVRRAAGLVASAETEAHGHAAQVTLEQLAKKCCLVASLVYSGDGPTDGQS